LIRTGFRSKDPNTSLNKKAGAAVSKAGKVYSLEQLDQADRKHAATAGLLIRAMKIEDPAIRERVMGDIRELRERYAGTPMEYKAPNGKDSLLIAELGEEKGRQAWYAVRTPGFKEWFGDWERASRIGQFKNSKVIEVDASKIIPSSNLKEYRKNAYQYGKTIAGKYKNKSDGFEFVLTTSSKLGSLKEILEHDYKDVWHLQSIAAIPEIAENAIFITSELNEDPGKHPEIQEFRYYLSKIKIDDTEYVVKSIISIANDGKRYYDHKLTEIKKKLRILPPLANYMSLWSRMYF
jgi:hypothetical protein